MDRLTNVNESMPLLKSENFIYWQNVYDRLAAYENAGLSPEEVEVLFHRSKRDDVVIPDVTFFGKPLEHWDEIDKAEIEGRLVILPCKVGDKVWFDTWEHGIKNVGIRPHKIDRVDITIVTNINELVSTNIPLQELGETVFLTREEAEKALKAN